MSYEAEMPGMKVTREQLQIICSRYYFASQFVSGKQVLEVGCGPGLGLGYLSRRAVKVIGGDYAEDNLRCAQQHYRDRIELVRLDAHNLPFKDNCFDVVVAMATVIYLQLDSFFKECAALAYVPATTKRDEGRIRIPFIASSLMKRFVWEAVGGFPPFRAAEDLIFMEAIEKKKFKIAYMPEAVAYWQIPGDWTRTFWRFAKYSRHNLIAKRARYWHYGVARLYGAGAIFLALALVHSPAWALLPAVGLIGRTIRTAYRKRCAFAFRDVFRPKRLLYLLGLLVVMDAATAWGFCVWVWGDRLFRTSP